MQLWQCPSSCDQGRGPLQLACSRRGSLGAGSESAPASAAMTILTGCLSKKPSDVVQSIAKALQKLQHSMQEQEPYGVEAARQPQPSVDRSPDAASASRAATASLGGLRAAGQAAMPGLAAGSLPDGSRLAATSAELGLLDE